MAKWIFDPASGLLREVQAASGGPGTGLNGGDWEWVSPASYKSVVLGGGGGGGDFMADGSVPMTGQFQAIDGTVLLPGIAFVADPDSGLYRPAAGELALAIDGLIAADVRRTGANGDVFLGVRGKQNNSNARVSLYNGAAERAYMEYNGNAGKATVWSHGILRFAPAGIGSVGGVLFQYSATSPNPSSILTADLNYSSGQGNHLLLKGGYTNNLAYDAGDLILQGGENTAVGATSADHGQVVFRTQDGATILLIVYDDGRVFFGTGLVSEPALKPNGAALETRLGDDSGFSIHRGADPVGADDLSTKRYADVIQANLTAHEADVANPHAVTAVQAGADPAGTAAAVQTNLNTHEADLANPHAVTAAQAGADPAGASAAVQANLNTHEADTGNPHSVTAAQAGADPAGSAAGVMLPVGTVIVITGSPPSYGTWSPSAAWNGAYPPPVGGWMERTA